MRLFFYLLIVCFQFGIPFAQISSANNEALPEEGSGGRLAFSDDEDFGESGSGSGSGAGVEEPDIIIDETPIEPVTSPPRNLNPVTPGRPLTLCEEQRDKQRGLYTSRRDDMCDENGEFEPMQCSDYSSDCWCVDRSGTKIPGTVMESPNMPSCDTGDNLTPCVFELVLSQRGSGNLSYKPKCTQDGSFFVAKQCSGQMCFCVDTLSGRVMQETTRLRTDSYSLICDGEDSNIDLPFPEDPKTDDKGNNDIDLNIDETGTDDTNIDDRSWEDNFGDNIDIPGGKVDDKYNTGDDDYSRANKENEVQMKENSVEDQIMTQPGILAGIIGGSVVLLLCLVLLVMFIIYRMRKKDEGSYPMDETNRRLPNYSYHHVRPDKEFYA